MTVVQPSTHNPLRHGLAWSFLSWLAWTLSLTSQFLPGSGMSYGRTRHLEDVDRVGALLRNCDLTKSHRHGTVGHRGVSSVVCGGCCGHVSALRGMCVWKKARARERSVSVSAPARTSRAQEHNRSMHKLAHACPHFVCPRTSIPHFRAMLYLPVWSGLILESGLFQIRMEKNLTFSPLSLTNLEIFAPVAVFAPVAGPCQQQGRGRTFSFALDFLFFHP